MFYLSNPKRHLGRIEAKIDALNVRIASMALDLSKLTAAASAAEATIADLRAKLAAALAAVENPADQATVDQITSELTAATTTTAPSS